MINTRGGAAEVFFRNVDDDAVFGVRDLLITRGQPVKNDEALDFAVERQPYAKMRADFALAPNG